MQLSANLLQERCKASLTSSNGSQIGISRIPIQFRKSSLHFKSLKMNTVCCRWRLHVQCLCQAGPSVLVLVPASGGRVIALSDGRGEEGKEGPAGAAATADLSSAAGASYQASRETRRARAERDSASGAAGRLCLPGGGCQPVQGMSPLQLTTVHVSVQ